MILERIFQKREAVDPIHPRDPVLVDMFGGGSNTASGIRVTPDKAMQLSAVFACVRIKSSITAMLPLKLYRKTGDDSRKEATEYPLYSLLHDQPNKWQTSYEWRQLMACHLELRGNGYSEIIPKNASGIDELIPLHPDHVTPFGAPDNTVAYYYNSPNSEPRIILQHEMHHIRGMSFDGIKGLSPIEYLKETIALTMAAEEFGGRFFSNGTNLGGVLEHPNKLGAEAFENLRKSWSDRHQGVNRSSKPAILEEGMKWHALGVPPDQAQFLETRKFQIAEIARIFGVPPHMLADVEKSTSWGTGIEQQSLGFVIYSLSPGLKSWQQAIKRDLISEKNKRKLFAEFDVKGLLEGDSKARALFYKELWFLGSINADEIRKKENMPPIENGDKYYIPLNMKATDEATPNENDNNNNDDDEDSKRSLLAIHKKTFRAELNRVVSCEVKTLRRALKSSGEDLVKFEKRYVEFSESHEFFVRKHLTTFFQADIDDFWNRYLKSSQEEMVDALKNNQVEELLNDWNESKTNLLFETEYNKSLEVIGL